MGRQNTEIRKAQIKQAILELIAEQGLHAISTRNLAKKVGVTEGALFRHFANKNEMFISIMHDVRSDLLETLRQIAFSDLPPKDRLFKFLCTHIRYLVNHRGITIFLFSEAIHANNQQLKDLLREILLSQKEFVAKIIKDGMEQGIWDGTLDIDSTTRIYLGIPISLNIELILNPKGLKPDNFCKDKFDCLMRILRRCTNK